MLQEIYILDLIGTFTFAIYGTYFGLKKDFDIFGVFVCAFLTAVGGGTVRDIIFKKIPFYFNDANYILAIILAIFFTMVVCKKFHKIELCVLVFDAIGLVTFAFIGASKASQMGLGIFAVAFFATLTAVGGGVIRDLILNEIPKIMYTDFYASVAILLGLLYGLFSGKMDSFFWANMLIISCLIVRLFVIYKKINLWNPNKYFSLEQEEGDEDAEELVPLIKKDCRDSVADLLKMS